MQGALVDAYGRVATDLRISVTDRCDLRCTYCMPAEGLDWLPAEELLSFDEIGRLARVLVGLGIRTVRLTGGEPLVRPRLAELVERLDALGLDDLALTTNGTTLARHARQLAAAGLDRVNVSLDSLVSHRFAEITRRDALDRVLAGIDAATEAGLAPVKVNVVVVAGTNDDEVVEFAAFAAPHRLRRALHREHAAGRRRSVGRLERRPRRADPRHGPRSLSPRGARAWVGPSGVLPLRGRRTRPGGCRRERDRAVL